MNASWSKVTLAEVCQIVGGGTPRTSVPGNWDGEILWATPKDLSEQRSRYISTTSRSITTAGLESSGAQILPARSVLLSSRAPIGLVAVNAVPMATNQGFKSLVPDKSRIDPDFLAHWLAASTEYLQSLGTGATFKEISKSVVAKISVPLPPLAEQRRIARVLDSAVANGAQRRHSRWLLDELIAATWHERFGTRGWQTEALTSLCDCVSGATPAKAEPENWVGDVPWFSAKDLKTPDLTNSIDRVSRAVVDRRALRLFPPGTVLLVVRGMILSHTIPVCTLRVPGTINQDLKALVPRRAVDPDFLSVCLRSQSQLVLQLVSTAAHGTTRLDRSALDAIRIPLPPVGQQREFGAFARGVRDLQASVDRGRRVVEDLFASLQHRAFTGAL